jgi:endogenous inhibitor of DNA gyrase (YacG/DUF329 family)
MGRRKKILETKCAECGKELETYTHPRYKTVMARGWETMDHMFCSEKCANSYVNRMKKRGIQK